MISKTKVYQIKSALRGLCLAGKTYRYFHDTGTLLVAIGINAVDSGNMLLTGAYELERYPQTGYVAVINIEDLVTTLRSRPDGTDVGAIARANGGDGSLESASFPVTPESKLISSILSEGKHLSDAFLYWPRERLHSLGCPSIEDYFPGRF